MLLTWEANSNKGRLTMGCNEKSVALSHKPLFHFEHAMLRATNCPVTTFHSWEQRHWFLRSSGSKALSDRDFPFVLRTRGISLASWLLLFFLSVLVECLLNFGVKKLEQPTTFIYLTTPTPRKNTLLGVSDQCLPVYVGIFREQEPNKLMARTIWT